MAIPYRVAEEALEGHVTDPGLRRHCRGVAASMAHLARVEGEDVDRWRVAGLLHDLDWEETPESHPYNAVEWIGRLGGDAETREAVLGHVDGTGASRSSRMARALYAVDELSGFVLAVALVRPTRLDGMTVSSVKKKLKTLSFAAAVDRDHLQRASDEGGYDFPDLVRLVIEALQEDAGALFPEAAAS